MFKKRIAHCQRKIKYIHREGNKLEGGFLEEKINENNLTKIEYYFQRKKSGIDPFVKTTPSART